MLISFEQFEIEIFKFVLSYLLVNFCSYDLLYANIIKLFACSF